MPTDIREVLNSLDDEDKRLWSIYRTEMRRTFINAHNAVLGCTHWDESDDIFLDYIDVKLALLFNATGRMNNHKVIVAPEDAEKLEKIMQDASDKLKEKEKVEPSEATKSLTKGWGLPNGSAGK